MIGGTAIPPTKEQRERLKDLLDLADNLRNLQNNGVEGKNYVDILDPVANRNLAEAYVRGDISCHLHVLLEAWGQDLHAHDLCIRFVKPRISGVGHTSINELDFRLREKVGDHSHFVATPDVHRDKQPVFVSVGQFLQSDEGMLTHAELKVGRSAARLVPMDKCPMFGSHLAQGTGSTGRVGFGEVLGANIGGRPVFDRELNSPRAPGLPSATVEKSELPSQVVEGTPKIVDRITDDKRPAIQRPFRGACCRPEDVVAAFGLELYADEYRVQFRSLRNTAHPDIKAKLVLKDITVLFGSVQLGPATAEVGSVGHD